MMGKGRLHFWLPLASLLLLAPGLEAACLGPWETGGFRSGTQHFLGDLSEQDCLDTCVANHPTANVINVADNSNPVKECYCHVDATPNLILSTSYKTQYIQHACGVDGAWAAWVSGACTVTCGGGTLTRTRTCTNPAPAQGGADCPGFGTQQVDCGVEWCPVDGAWTAWAGGTCSVTCGGGTLTQTRTCTNPAPAQGGADCPGFGTQQVDCGVQWCPVDGAWTDWVDGTCTVTCGGGTITQTRSCTNPVPEHGGTDCVGPDTQQGQACNNQDCPPEWLQWGEWGACSKTCGGGYHQRKRDCSVEGQCVGSDKETGLCGTGPCPGVAAKVSGVRRQGITLAARDEFLSDHLRATFVPHPAVTVPQMHCQLRCAALGPADCNSFLYEDGACKLGGAPLDWLVGQKGSPGTGAEMYFDVDLP